MLGGDWAALSGRIPGFPSDGLAGVARGQVLTFDTAGLGHWDRRLIAFLRDTERTAAAAGVFMDRGTLSNSAHRLLGLLSGKLAQPSSSSCLPSIGSDGRLDYRRAR